MATKDLRYTGATKFNNPLKQYTGTTLLEKIRGLKAQLQGFRVGEVDGFQNGEAGWQTAWNALQGLYMGYGRNAESSLRDRRLVYVDENVANILNTLHQEDVAKGSPAPAGYFGGGVSVADKKVGARQPRGYGTGSSVENVKLSGYYPQLSQEGNYRASVTAGGAARKVFDIDYLNSDGTSRFPEMKIVVAADGKMLVPGSGAQLNNLYTNGDVIGTVALKNPFTQAHGVRPYSPTYWKVYKQYSIAARAGNADAEALRQDWLQQAVHSNAIPLIMAGFVQNSDGTISHTRYPGGGLPEPFTQKGAAEAFTPEEKRALRAGYIMMKDPEKTRLGALNAIALLYQNAKMLVLPGTAAATPLTPQEWETPKGYAHAQIINDEIDAGIERFLKSTNGKAWDNYGFIRYMPNPALKKDQRLHYGKDEARGINYSGVSKLGKSNAMRKTMHNPLHVVKGKDGSEHVVGANATSWAKRKPSHLAAPYTSGPGLENNFRNYLSVHHSFPVGTRGNRGKGSIRSEYDPVSDYQRLGPYAMPEGYRRGQLGATGYAGRDHTDGNAGAYHKARYHTAVGDQNVLLNRLERDYSGMPPTQRKVSAAHMKTTKGTNGVFSVDRATHMGATKSGMTQQTRDYLNQHFNAPTVQNYYKAALGGDEKGGIDYRSTAAFKEWSDRAKAQQAFKEDRYGAPSYDQVHAYWQSHRKGAKVDYSQLRPSSAHDSFKLQPGEIPSQYKTQKVGGKASSVGDNLTTFDDDFFQYDNAAAKTRLEKEERKASKQARGKFAGSVFERGTVSANRPSGVNVRPQQQRGPQPLPLPTEEERLRRQQSFKRPTETQTTNDAKKAKQLKDLIAQSNSLNSSIESITTAAASPVTSPSQRQEYLSEKEAIQAVQNQTTAALENVAAQLQGSADPVIQNLVAQAEQVIAYNKVQEMLEAVVPRGRTAPYATFAELPARLQKNIAGTGPVTGAGNQKMRLNAVNQFIAQGKNI